MRIAEKLVLERQRHLKWRALDGLELVLMILCGLLLFGFSTTVVFDIVTRTIGHPWLWLQEVTQTFFIYGIFVGAAVATRRNDHLYLTAVAEALHGMIARCFAKNSFVWIAVVCFSGSGIGTEPLREYSPGEPRSEFLHGERPTRRRRGPIRPGGRRARPPAPAAARAERQVRDRHDPKRIRYGCFLPDLTGLATAPPTPAPRGGYIRSRGGRRKACLGADCQQILTGFSPL